MKFNMWILSRLNLRSSVITVAAQDRIIVKPPFTERDLKNAFIPLSYTRKKKNKNKHEGVVEKK